MNGGKDGWRISFPLITTILLFGGFYSFSVYFVGAMILLLLFLWLGKIKKSKLAKDEMFYGSILLCVSAFASVFAGVNKGMAWLGFLRVVVLLLWVFYLMQFSAKQRERGLSVLPWTGGIMVIVGLLSLSVMQIFPSVTGWFWQAERFGGTFQYSNTCALFLIIGMIILSGQTKVDKKELILFDLLLVGAFLTGSKGGILLLVPVFIWIVVKRKSFRENGICMLLVLAIAGLIYGFVSGNFQNIARIYTLFRYPSTLLGRLLYMKDAFPILFSHPLGIGYMGYAGMQSAIQTGVYTSLFVHNDWLQMGLDYGWLFLFVALGVVIYQLVKGRQETYKKVALFVICFYSLLEFHLQYLSIVMVIPLLMDVRENTLVEKKSVVAKENQILSLVGLLLFGYFGIASFCTYAGKYETALSMYPYDTQALEAVLMQESDKVTATALAEDILSIHPYSTESYNVLAYGALMDGSYERALNYKLEVLKLEKYDTIQYGDFVSMVETIQSVSEANRALCEEKLGQMQRILEETKEQTDTLAYYLRDKPTFTIQGVNED